MSKVEPEVYMINSGYDGCCYVRLHLPCIYNGYKTDKPSLREDKINTKDVKHFLDRADVVVFHRAEEQTYHDLAKMLKANGKKIVMDNDDTFKIEGFHPLAQFMPDGTPQENLQRRERNLNEFMEMCDLVTTSTETLAEEYREHNDNVVVLPNYIDPDDWDEPMRNEGDKVRIGIVGSVSVEYDYLHIKPLLKKLSERNDVELVLFGLQDKKTRKKNPMVSKVFKAEYAFWDSLNKEQFPWVKRYDYNERLNEAKLDLMLIPRRDNYFNRCKSNVKFLEAAMCEIPVIAQSFDNGPYEELEQYKTGVKIRDNSTIINELETKLEDKKLKSTKKKELKKLIEVEQKKVTDKWEEEVDKLINDKKLRREIGKNAREYTIKNYNIEDHYQKWDNAYSSLFKTI